MYIQRNKNILAFLKFSWLYEIRYRKGGKKSFYAHKIKNRGA